MKIINIDQLNIRDSLPSPKGVALSILQMCNNEDISIHDITKLIQTDPTLSYRLIHRANITRRSSRQIASVTDAVQHLGINTVKQLAMTFSLVDQYQQGNCKAFNYQLFWSHALFMGIALEAFGSVIRVSVKEELFACGLLARIGCLALATIYPKVYSDILENNDQHRSLIEQEHLYLEANHNEMTAAMLINAGFAKQLVEPIYYHEEPLESGFPENSRSFRLAQLFHLAKHLADVSVTNEPEFFEQTSELMLLAKKIGFETNSFPDMVQDIIQEWKSWKTLLKLPVDNISFKTVTETIEKISKNDQEAASLRVMVVEDEPVSRNLIEGILSNTLGHTVFTAENGKQGLSMALDTIPHVVITDWMMPEMDGLELTHALRATEWGQSMYIIMLTGVEEEEKLAKAFEIGVDDYIIKPINIPTFRARLRAAWHYRRLQDSWSENQKQLKEYAANLAISNRKLKQAAYTDTLTGLPNRRAGMETLSRAWKISNRTDQSLAAILIDIDYFKRVNDTYGHAAGDVVLKSIATTIRNTARKGDFFCRIGGEEFLMICQDKKIDTRSTVIMAERMRELISSTKIDIHDELISVTISIGIALKEPSMETEEQLIKTADKALYAAKNAGRNRVYAATDDHVFEPDISF